MINAVTELSFSAAILTGNCEPVRGDQAEGLQRARELFYDVGVEEVILVDFGSKTDFSGLPRVEVPARAGVFDGLFAAASLLKGTHLLVLDLSFGSMDPTFIIRLMQMSCLGMGVLPVVRGQSEPTAACYPRSILTLKNQDGRRESPDGRATAEWAAIKGLVARYLVPASDEVYFSRAPFAAVA